MNSDTSIFSPSIEPLYQAVDEGHPNIRIIGLSGSSRAWLSAKIFQYSKRPILVVLPSSDLSHEFHQDLKCWMDWIGESQNSLAYFPDLEILSQEKSQPDPDLLQQSIQTLNRLCSDQPCIITTPVTALTQEVLPKRFLIESSIKLSRGTQYDREELIKKWVDMGYRRVDLVEHPGEFCVRGGLIDIFSPIQNNPVRAEWSGDDLESLSFFDPDSQLSNDPLSELSILPFELIRPPGSESPSDTLKTYLSSKGIEIWIDPEICLKKLPASHKTLLQPGVEKTFISFSNISTNQGISNTDKTVEIEHQVRSPESLGLGLPGVPLTKTIEIIREMMNRARIMVITKSKGQQEKMAELFREHQLSVQSFPHTPVLNESSRGRTLQKGPILIGVGDLSNGFYDLHSGILVITDEDLFGKGTRHRPPSKPRRARLFSSLEDLKIKDFVVHLQHGIGQYQGIKRLQIRGFESDFFEIRYLGGDVLYVPLDHLNLIQKYKGVEGRIPYLDRLGGLTWAKTTRKVKKQVELIAKELLQLYAVREVTNTQGCAPDTGLTNEFEAAFEFEETPDQFQTIQDVKYDMEKPRPMDRLVCGDVGYGKTEVAMRAAFKAVMENRQVAILVPTTILAHQHFLNFRQRFSPFAIRVEMLSRFCTREEIETIKKDLGLGKVDIVIGTHRLLQKDIHFRNLGLLIIDEEQRFGVSHKEIIKQLRQSIDVLTLTATPIPRTLQMSLVGLRDLSTIDTPPPDRLAVRTTLAQFGPNVIRKGFEREMSRGGKIFFVHNRIDGIERMADYLSKLTPGIRIGLAHGRMRERALESVMFNFINGKYDVLLSTSIIESGLDIPSANTIFINNAHRFGLADLYQLRGRVGRSSQQAYATLLVPSESILTPVAQERLSALQEFCELGSGFRIAARDLEIRGAGHLLGKKQSGQIASVGIDYYLQLIEKTVRQLKGTEVEETVDPVLDLPISAFIPEDYISDVHQRLGVYRRLSDMNNENELSDLWSQLDDRYGALPESMERLGEIVWLKIISKNLGIEKISYGSLTVNVSFRKNLQLNDQQIDLLLSQEDDIRFLSEFSFSIHIQDTGWDEIYSQIKKCLEKLLGFDTRWMKK